MEEGCRSLLTIERVISLSAASISLTEATTWIWTPPTRTIVVTLCFVSRSIGEITSATWWNSPTGSRRNCWGHGRERGHAVSTIEEIRRHPLPIDARAGRRHHHGKFSRALCRQSVPATLADSESFCSGCVGDPAERVRESHADHLGADLSHRRRYRRSLFEATLCACVTSSKEDSHFGFSVTRNYRPKSR